MPGCSIHSSHHAEPMAHLPGGHFSSRLLAHPKAPTTGRGEGQRASPRTRGPSVSYPGPERTTRAAPGRRGPVPKPHGGHPAPVAPLASRGAL